MFEGIDAIDWHSLEHAYGDASNIPKWLHQLAATSEAECREAVDYLRASVYHQGGDYSAAPVVIPFLIEALQCRDRPVARAGILELLDLLTEGYRLARGLNQRVLLWPEYNDFFTQDVVEKIFPSAYQAAHEGGELYLELLDDDDSEVVAEAAHLVSGFPDLASRAIPPTLAALEHRLESWHATRQRPEDHPSSDCELEPSYITSLLLSLGMLIRHSGETAALSNLTRQRDSDHALCRLSAVLARIYAQQAMDDRDREIFTEALATIEWPTKVSAWGYPDSLVDFILDHLGAVSTPELPTMLLSGFLQAAAARGDRGDFTYPSYRMVFLIRSLFDEPEVAAATDARGEAPTVAIAELNAQSRRVLGMVCSALPLEELACFIELRKLDTELEHHGLPPLRELAADLGRVTPPRSTILARRVDLPDLSLVGIRLDEAWEQLANTTEAGSELLTTITAPLSSAELLELFERLLGSKSWNVSEESASHMLTAAEARFSNPDWLPALEAHTRAFDRRGSLNGIDVVGERSMCRMLVVLLTRTAEHHKSPVSNLVEELLAAGDVVVSYLDFSTTLAAALMTIPRPRRDRVIDLIRVYNHNEPDDAWALYNLIPSPSRIKRFIALMADWVEFFSQYAARPAVEVLVAQGQGGIDPLRRVLVDDSYPLRHLVAAALLHLGDVDRAEVFGGLVRDGDARVAQLASWACENEQPPSEELLARADIPTTPSADRRGGVIGRDGRLWDGKRWR